MAIPGLMFVISKAKEHVSDQLYNRFYNEEHLPDVLRYDVANIALRYKNISTDAEIPYLALYPVPDAAYFASPDAGKIVSETRISKTFDNDDIYDHIDFDIRAYVKIQTFEGYQQGDKIGLERGQTIVCVTMEPAEGKEQDFNDWYSKQHLDMLSMCRGYIRTTRFKRIDERKPRYLALHEYACKAADLPSDQIAQVTATEWSKRILSESPTFDIDTLEVIQVQGNTSLKL